MKGKQSRRWRFEGIMLRAAAIGALVATGIAAAQPAAERLTVPALIPPIEQLVTLEVDPAIRALVHELGSRDFARRMQAMHLLRTTPEDEKRPPRAAMLAALLHTASPDLEQRARLLRVLRELMIEAPRGALGIRMNLNTLQDAEHRGIEIIDLIDGMPAADVLVARDRITHIEETPLTSAEDLIVLVQSRRPGDTVRLKLLRPRRTAEGADERGPDGRVMFEVLTAEVTLGSSTGLLDPAAPRGSVPMSPVVSRRTMEWNELVATYALQPTVLVPSPDIPRSALSQLLVAAGPLNPDFRVDDHEIVRTLRSQLSQVIDGRLALTNELVEQWLRTHRDLLRAAEQPDLAPHERDIFTRLADRYDEMLRLLEIPGQR